MNHPLILLVEDEPLVRELITFMLADISADVVAVETAEHAATLLDSRPWDMLITDVQTPGAIDGFHLAWAAFEQIPKVPVVVTSGFTVRANEPLPPCATFVAKPWDVTRFLRVVSERLNLPY